MLRQAPVVTAIPVSDLDRAKAFYRDTLGLEIILEGETEALFAAGRGTMLGIYQPVKDAGPERTVAGFGVPDLGALVAELEARGVRFEDYDLADFRTDGHIVEIEGRRNAFFRDSESNLLALDEVPAQLFEAIQEKLEGGGGIAHSDSVTQSGT